MRVLMSGGGTAGHIYPALTAADRLRDDGHEVEFIGTAEGPEARLAREAGLVFHELPARGFDRSRPLSLAVAVMVLVRSVVRARSLLRRVRGDVVVGFGGYVSLPVGIAAATRRIPLVLHEQNSVPGMANRVLGRYAKAVGVTYAGSAERIRTAATIVHTGNPVRTAILDADRDSGRRVFQLPADADVVLVFGGSRGARHLNEAVVDSCETLLARENVRVLHIAGPAEAESVRARLSATCPEAWAERYRVLDYVEEMGAALAASDIVVARAGATSIAEITAVGRPAILVPYPFATDDHQTLNATDVAAAGGAIVVADAALDEGALLPPLVRLLDNEDERERMASASARMGVRDATERLADLIVRAAGAREEGEVRV